MSKPGITRVLLARGCGFCGRAGMAGLNRSYISAVERVEYNVSLDNIEKIARAFGMTVEELLARELSGVEF